MSNESYSVEAIAIFKLKLMYFLAIMVGVGISLLLEDNRTLFILLYMVLLGLLYYKSVSLKKRILFEVQKGAVKVIQGKNNVFFKEDSVLSVESGIRIRSDIKGRAEVRYIVTFVEPQFFGKKLTIKYKIYPSEIESFKPKLITELSKFVR